MSDHKEKSLKFRLEIELGNDAMNTGEHVYDLLATLAAKLREYNEDELRQAAHSHTSLRLADINGNTVGFWRIDP